MRRISVFVASMIVALCACLFGRPPLVERADAADDVLTPAMKQQIDASLIVFVGKVKRSSTAPDTSDMWKASFEVERYLKGACFEPELDLVHVSAERGAVATKTTAAPAPGERFIVGAQLLQMPGPMDYELHCDAEQLAPAAWTRPLEDAVLRHVVDAPRVPTLPKANPERLEQKRRMECMSDLSQLAQVYLLCLMDDRAKAQKWSGAALWLSMRKGERCIKRGEEHVLICPADPAAHPPTSDAERKAWDDVDLSRPAAGLCSYAGRDFAKFPLDPKVRTPQVIGACLHHKGGVMVAFDSGDIQFIFLEELGLASEAEKIVGPDSKSPLLRVLRY
jgi:hypothetical protein